MLFFRRLQEKWYSLLQNTENLLRILRKVDKCEYYLQVNHLNPIKVYHIIEENFSIGFQTKKK